MTGHAHEGDRELVANVIDFLRGFVSHLDAPGRRLLAEEVRKLMRSEFDEVQRRAGGSADGG